MITKYFNLAPEKRSWWKRKTAITDTGILAFLTTNVAAFQKQIKKNP